jgi:hypothetical protein
VSRLVSIFALLSIMPKNALHQTSCQALP